MGDTRSNSRKTRLKLIDAKRVMKFLCLFILVYGLLMCPWPGLGAGYTRLYRAGAAFLFRSFGEKGVVRFLETGEADHDMKILFFNREQVDAEGRMVPVGSVGHDTRVGGYIPTAFTIALILATPVVWRRKGWALFWGMILTHVFLVLKLAIWVLYGFNHEPLSLLVLNPFWTRVLVFLAEVLIRGLTFHLIVSVFIWISVSFRREDWPGILTTKQDSPNGIGNKAGITRSHGVVSKA